MNQFELGKPILRIGDSELELDGVTEFKPLLVEETVINDEERLFWNDNMEHSISFEIPNYSPIFKSLGKLFKYRIPRKKKKAYKKAFCARFGIPLSKAHFCMSFFNNQRRLKRMVDKTFILKENSEEIRKKITDSGISVCLCASFAEADWLEYSTLVDNGVHGHGYPFEGMTKEETRALFLHEVKNPIWCDTVDEFIKLIKEFKDGKTE